MYNQQHGTTTRWLATQFGVPSFPETISFCKLIFNQGLSRWRWCRLQGDPDPWKGGDGEDGRVGDEEAGQLSGLNLNKDGGGRFLLVSRSNLLLGDLAEVWKSESVKVWKSIRSWTLGGGWRGAWGRGCQRPPSPPSSASSWQPRPLRRSSDQATMS